jgi:hypothetical protein
MSAFFICWPAIIAQWNMRKPEQTKVYNRGHFHTNNMIYGYYRINKSM